MSFPEDNTGRQSVGQCSRPCWPSVPVVGVGGWVSERVGECWVSGCVSV